MAIASFFSALPALPHLVRPSPETVGTVPFPHVGYTPIRLPRQSLIDRFLLASAKGRSFHCTCRRRRDRSTLYDSCNSPSTGGALAALPRNTSNGCKYFQPAIFPPAWTFLNPYSPPGILHCSDPKINLGDAVQRI